MLAPDKESSIFHPCPENVSNIKFKGLIGLAEDVSKQEIIQVVSWLLLDALI